MALEFYSLRVKTVKRETPLAVSVSFDIPASLEQVFAYKHGQYLTLRVHIDGKSFNRAYSLCSMPGSGHRVAVKATEQGTVSRYLNEKVKAGDILEVMPPMGNFTIPLNASNQRTFVLIGGGSGITPLLSIAMTVLRDEPRSDVLLLYGNRDAQNIIFHDELQALEKENSGRFRVIHCLESGQPGFEALEGRLNASVIKTAIAASASKSTTQFFICGPAGMMNEAQSAIEQLGVDKMRVHREFFTAVPKEETKGPNPIEDAERQIGVKLYGKSFRINVEPDESILSAAIRNNYDPPYACQIAACCTCRAKLVTGQVHMESREALTDDEINDGYILTCQAHPLTDDVVVDYDQ